jgi:hypothetical protein
MIGEIGNFKMKKLLLILFIIPAFIYGQDVPLTEKKVTTESMENKERKLKEKADDKVQKENAKRTKKYNRSLAMHPKNQIGYIMNPSSCPFGLNYFNFFSESFGWYVDYRTDFNVLAPGEWALRDESWITGDMGGVPTGNLTEGGYNVFNVGLALNLFKANSSATILYIGYGSSTLEYFEEFAETYTGPYYANTSSEMYGNINFGILLQTDAILSGQIGFDSAVPGINFGIALTLY